MSEIVEIKRLALSRAQILAGEAAFQVWSGLDELPSDGSTADLVISLVSAVLAICPCGRAPKRKNQRNCHICNVEANAKHRRLKRNSDDASGQSKAA